MGRYRPTTKFLQALAAQKQGIPHNPSNLVSKETTTCNRCGTNELRWTWRFDTKKPVLLDQNYRTHKCTNPPPNQKDVYPGWCTKCNATDLLWLRKDKSFELAESYGLPHICAADSEEIVFKVSQTKCKYCKTDGLFWYRSSTSMGFKLLKADGSKHHCEEMGVYVKDFAEALRMDYAREKLWVNSFKDDEKCKKCKGEGRVTFMSKNKRIMAALAVTHPVEVSRSCYKCKTLGTFSAPTKAWYLKELRKKYWPFKGGKHKWKKYDKPVEF